MWSNNNKRQENDLYATRPHDVHLLFHYDDSIINGRIWECACGHGHIVNTLYELGATDIYASDLVDYGFGYNVSNFLEDYSHTGEFDTIMTNPPYKYATRFIQHALSQIKSGGRVIMLLPTTTICGIDRYRKVFKKHRPKYIYVFVRNTYGLLVGEGAGKISGTYLNHSWFIWEDGYNGETTLRWLYDPEDAQYDQAIEDRNNQRIQAAQERMAKSANKTNVPRLPKKITNEQTICTGIRKRGMTYEARIKHNGSYISLGSYATLEDALAARRAAEIKYRGN